MKPGQMPVFQSSPVPVKRHPPQSAAFNSRGLKRISKKIEDKTTKVGSDLSSPNGAAIMPMCDEEKGETPIDFS
jgi:hypothetical protein